MRIALVMALLLLPSLVAAEGIGWQEAVTRLAAERTRAEACVRMLKKHVEDEIELSRGDLVYSNAKAEIDGVISGLVVVLAEAEQPEKLESLEDRLIKGVEAREGFCADILLSVPELTEGGQKNPIVDLFGEVLEPLIVAVKEIYLRYRDDDAQRRETIRIQLEGTRWSPFGAIEP